ncbi:hypothetical protein B4086_5685 [Bacillus cereus]|nr:hypothetical protein B4086_5685 [Bacillus cereus]
MTVCEHRNEEMFRIASQYVEQGKTVLIGGSTGAGKTTLLKELLNFTGEDKVFAVGWDMDLKGINRSNVTVRDRHVTGLPLDIVEALGAGEPIRLAYDEIRGESVAPVMDVWNQTGKGLGTVIAPSVDLMSKYVLLQDVEVTKSTMEEATERFVKTVDVLVFMDYRHKDIRDIVEVDKSVTTEVKLIPVANATYVG